jgi:Tol biopolymer transport system component
MDAAGGNLRPATFNGIYFFGPTWSPDGGRIAFFSGGSIAVTTFPPSGDPLVSIAPRGGDNYDQDPDWSPDGSLIAFSRFTFVGSGGEGQDYSTIDVADPTGGEARALTTADYGNGDGHPSISPDGRTVVFSRGLPRGDPPVGRRVDLYTVPIGGGTPTLLTDTPTFNEREPVWSPDGTKIAFSGVQQAPSDPQPYCGQGSPHLTCDVYVINADGTGRRQLTSSPGDDWQPSWQPIPGPKRSDYENAAQFCKAARDFFGDEAFGKRYGTNGNGANAYGKCVSQSQ